MKAYLICTGSLFGLVGVAHGVRLLVEGGHPWSEDPGFYALNGMLLLVGGGIAAWAVTLLRRPRP